MKYHCLANRDGMEAALIRSGYVDSFARDRLPPIEEWPVLLLNRPEYTYPERLNCITRLLDEWVAAGHGGAPCLLSRGECLSYLELHERVNRIARVLVERYGLIPGNRVLLRAPNTPMLVAVYLAVMKAGGIAVATMPLLRSAELVYPIVNAEIALALTDIRLRDELDAAELAARPMLRRIVTFGSPEAELDRAILAVPPVFEAADTAADDVCLIGYTSGTTGVPKATMHFHRDVLAIADGYSAHVLRPRVTDRFIGSPPLAFTFGLGGLVVFPLAVGASSVLLESAAPDDMLAAIRDFRATILFTAPTAYRVLLGKLEMADISSLRICVSAGEPLPLATFEAWRAATGLKLMDGIGATEMLHIFIAAPEESIRPGAIGRPVPGYEAKLVDANGRDVPSGTAGHLAVRGPVGCRYLADPRQRHYVRDGWNITGDTFMRDGDGYFWYLARSDDMIVSSGYNIAGPEVERALASHPAVVECAVIGVPDTDRGTIVKAFVVARPGLNQDDALALELQNHVKSEIAPYKYPRAIEFRSELPRTASGKIQRSKLRDHISIEGKSRHCSSTVE